MQAQQQEAQHRDEVRAALMRDLEGARFAADRAFRQYDATDQKSVSRSPMKDWRHRMRKPTLRHEATRHR